MKIKEIKNRPNYYVSDSGKVFHKKKDGELFQLKTAFNNAGYEYLSLGDNCYYFVAELVWQTFMGDIPDGYELNHISSNRKDNRLSNLQMCTHRENCQLKEPSLIPAFTIKDNGKYYFTFRLFDNVIHGTYDDVDSMLKDFEVLRQTKIKMQKKLIKKINKRNKEYYGKA